MTAEKKCRERATLVSSVTALDNGDQLAVCVDYLGGTHYWVLRPLCAEHEAHATHGRGDAAHEQVGPLPTIYQQRLAQTPLRCGRRRRDGMRCRSGVSTAGGSCRHHREPLGADLGSTA